MRHLNHSSSAADDSTGNALLEIKRQELREHAEMERRAEERRIVEEQHRREDFALQQQRIDLERERLAEDRRAAIIREENARNENRQFLTLLVSLLAGNRPDMNPKQ